MVKRQLNMIGMALTSLMVIQSDVMGARSAFKRLPKLEGNVVTSEGILENQTLSSEQQCAEICHTHTECVAWRFTLNGHCVMHSSNLETPQSPNPAEWPYHYFEKDGAAGPCGTQPGIIFTPEGFCFKLITGELLNWTDAELRCQEDGLTNANLDSVNKQNSAINMCASQGISDRLVTGLYYNNDLSSWVWRNGSPTLSLQWGPSGAATSHDENCGYLDVAFSQWHSDTCQLTAIPLCEKVI